MHKNNKAKSAAPARRAWEAPHSGQTQEFPYIDYQRGKPMTEDQIRAAISWVTAAGMKYIHVGLDGKGERFDFQSIKPTREKLILAELGGGSYSIRSLKDLHSRLQQEEDLKMKAQEIMHREDQEAEAIEREKRETADAD